MRRFRNVTLATTEVTVDTEKTGTACLHTPRPPRWRVFRGEKGATMLEAALVTPVLLLLTFAIVDFAGMFYAYLALENGVSQATRYAVTGQLMDDPSNPGTPLSRVDSIKAAMRQATPTLTIPDTAFTFSHLPVGASSWAVEQVLGDFLAKRISRSSHFTR